MAKNKSKSSTPVAEVKSSLAVSAERSDFVSILPLNQIVGLPGDELGFTLQSRELINLVLNHQKSDTPLMTLSRNQFKTEQEVSHFGVTASVIESEMLPKKRFRFRLKFHNRSEVVWIEKGEGELLLCRHRVLERRALTPVECEASAKEIKDAIKIAQTLANLDEVDFAKDFSNFDEVSAKCAAAMDFPLEDRLTLLEGWSRRRRLKVFLELFHKNIKVLQLRQQLRQRTKDRMQKMEREAMLHEERRVIDQELNKGQKNCPPEFTSLKEDVETFKGPEDVKTVLNRDFERLLRSGPGSPQSSTLQDYIETLLEVPWQTSASLSEDWDKIEQTLKDSHYGLEAVKNRLLRYLAVVALSGAQPGAILCLVGPPGVGKTSFAKAIAKALDLPFVKKSLGGVRDESDVRGHRRTYMGAMPGRIVQGLRKVKCNNPVFLLDEVDKLSNDHRGDPSSALLEVLDPEENYRFSDHYLELDLDLSKIFWVLTANDAEQIPSALRDRLEIVEFSSYTEMEKLHIAKDYLCQRNMEKHGLGDTKLRLSDAVLRKLIREYTREAGVRGLDRKVATLVQHLALEKLRHNKRGGWTISAKKLSEVLGPGQHTKALWTKSSWGPGVMAGLAWTATGGAVMRLECARIPGKGELRLTGKLGDVMKESAYTAFSFLKTERKSLAIDEKAFSEQDFHIHIPAGAVPKEGPSAGLGLAMLLYSALSQTSGLPYCAMTGEITLHGKVLAIGGVKEKLLAAYQEGFDTVVLPLSNRADVDNLEIEELENVNCIFVDHFRDAFKAIFPAKKET